MASRWRWPPETFDPPWLIGRLEPALHLLTKVRAWAIVRACQSSLVGRVRGAVAEVAGDRPAEQEGPLGDDPDEAPEVLLAEVADVDAVDRHRSPGHVVEARDQVDQGRLAAAGAAHDRGRLARTGREGDRPQDRVLGTRVAELDVPELDHDRAAPRSGPASAGSWIATSVSRTSWIRSAEAAARGTMTNMIVAIITEKRICMT